MRTYRFLLLFLAFGLASGFVTQHKFYVSVTNVAYSEKDQRLQVTTRIFIDDLEAVLGERYGVKTNLATEQEIAEADEYIARYLKTKMVFTINDAPVSYEFLAKRYDTDVVICYLELPVIPLSSISSIGIENEVLTDMFEEQQNIVHFRIGKKKRSFLLFRENNKGMLNFP